MTRKQPTSPNEIRALLGLVKHDLAQAETPGLLPDGRYVFLYNAALQLATTVLRLHDVRVGQAGHHRETFHAVGEFVPSELRCSVTHFERSRRMRHRLTYDQAGAVSKTDADGLRESVSVFAEWVRRLADAYLAAGTQHGDDEAG